MKSAGKLMVGVLALMLLAGSALVVLAYVKGRSANAGIVSSGPSGPAGQGAWATARVMPTFRSEHAATVLEGKIYVAGGLAGSSPIYTGVTNVVEVYDPSIDAWQSAAPLPRQLHHFGMAALDGEIYVTGGYDDDFTPDVQETWVYRPRSDTWMRVADMPAPRAAHASVGMDSLLYVVGGVGSGSNALWIYDPESNTWDTSRSPLPTIREHLTAAGVGGKLYVIGGRWSGQGNLNTLEMFDPVDATWHSKSNMPTRRGGLTAATVGNLIHVTGGEDLGSALTFNQHEVYDPATDSWATYPNLPTARHGLPSGTVNGRWYVIGGGLRAGGQTYSSLSNIVEVFVPTIK